METAAERYKSRLIDNEKCYRVGDLWFPGTPESHVQIRNLKIRPDDTAVICYPKSGTHWLYRILTYINTDGDLDQAEHYPFRPLEVSPPHLSKTAIELAEAAPSPRIIATHLPFELCPDELQAGKCKIILIIRNPKDVAVSHFHFHKRLKYVGEFEDFPWADFVEAFCDPVALPFGSWFANVKNWLQHKDDPNVLTVFYEDLKKNLTDGVSTVAEFIGRPVNEDRAAAIAHLCDFTTVQASSQSSSFILRKGVIGDWKNHFTVAQSEMFDRVYQREMAGYTVPVQFE